MKQTKQALSPLQEAKQFLSKRDYKRALELYKTLWKQKPTEEHREGIRDCYLGRFEELKNKGMYREAIVFWENHSSYCTDCSHVLPYVLSLLASGLYAKAITIYYRDQQTFSEHNQFIIEEKFAALLLSGTPELEKVFPPELSLYKDFLQAKQAVLACAKQDRESTEQALRAIPYRSAYKYLQPLLKACLLITQNKEAALDLLKRIPNTSIFHRLATLVQASVLNKFKLVEVLLTLNGKELSFLSGLKNWSEDRAKSIQKFSQIPIKASPKILFEQIKKSISQFDHHTARRICYFLLPSYRGGVKVFEDLFGSLKPHEKKHIEILTVIQSQSQASCPHCLLHRYEETLAATLPDSPSVRLQRALVLRQAAIFEKSVKNLDDNTLNAECIALLENSLQLDPYDKESYLELINHYRKKGSKIECYRWIKKSLTAYPTDREIFSMAIKQYRQNQDPKEAIVLINQLLVLDPLNTTAHCDLIHAELEQVQKMVRKNKITDARHAFDKIALTERTNSLLPLWQFNAGVLHYLENKSDEALFLIKQASPDIEQCLSARLTFLMEANHFQIPLADLEAALKLTPTANLAIKNSAHCLQLLQWLESYQVDASIQQSLFTFIEKIFHRAASLSFTEAEIIILCEKLTRMKQFLLLDQFLKKQNKYFSTCLTFGYYKINTKVKGSPAKVSNKDFDALETIYFKAQRVGDERTLSLVGRFLTIASELQNPFSNGVSVNNIRDLLDDHLPPEIREIFNNMDDGERENLLESLFSRPKKKKNKREVF